MNIKAIYPGTFDPITFGHEDLVKRASHIFELVIVAVAYKTQKNTLFSFEDRFDMCSEVLKKYKNVKVINMKGQTLSDAVLETLDEELGGITKKDKIRRAQLSYTKKVENAKKVKILGILEKVFGAGKVAVSIDAEIDFLKESNSLIFLNFFHILYLI